jgi:hypothetical protein
MFAKTILAAVGGIAIASVQFTPPVSTLSTIQSGVLPYLPVSTGFTGLETIEGAIVYDGPVVDGFTGSLTPFLKSLSSIPILNEALFCLVILVANCLLSSLKTSN